MTAVFLALLLAVPQEPLEKQVASLVVRLRADELEAREGASREMIALGESAIGPIEKAAAGSSDPETVTRLKGIVDQIRRNVIIAKVAPPVKLVTVSAKEMPLRDFLKDVCGQAGVEFACDAAGHRTVTLAANKQPVLQVLDRACAESGDLTATNGDGRLRISAGKWAGDPTAYAEGYRIRIKKIVLTDTIEGGAARTSVALYFELDAQPDHKVRGTSMTLPRAAALPGGGDIAVKGLAEMSSRVGGWIAAGVGAPVIDGVAVNVEAVETLDRVCLIKDLPPGIKKLDSLKVTGRFRYSVGFKSIILPLSGRNYDKLPEIPYHVNFSGAQLVFQPAEMTRAPLEDFVDLDQLTLIGKDGKETKLTPLAGGMRARQYYYQSEQSFQGETPQLRLQVMDALDREVEFELKDIKLRD
jgi:hypothetical protein